MKKNLLFVERRDCSNSPIYLYFLEELKLEVDLLKTANRMEHYTENYGVSNLVVRRGQPLSLKVKVNREFNEAKDRLNLIFSTGMGFYQVLKRSTFDILPA